MKASKHATNSRKTIRSWERYVVNGRLRGQWIYDVDRNFFEVGGPKPGGGSQMLAATEEALEMVYETY